MEQNDKTNTPVNFAKPLENKRKDSSNMTALTLSLPALFIAALNFKWDHTEASEVQNVILSVMLILVYAFTVLMLV